MNDERKNTPSFRVGQRVERTGHDDMRIVPVGARGTITDSSSDFVCVLWDGDAVACGYGTHSFPCLRPLDDASLVVGIDEACDFRDAEHARAVAAMMTPEMIAQWRDHCDRMDKDFLKPSGEEMTADTATASDDPCEGVAATAKTGDASASRSVASCLALPCVVCDADAWMCERDECANAAHAGGCQLSDGRWVCSRACWDEAARRAEPCPRCAGPTTPDPRDREPYCAACGAQARWLRKMPAPTVDPHATMRARYEERSRLALKAAAHADSIRDFYRHEDAAFPHRACIAAVPCIHAATRGMTPCACERAEHGKE